MASWSDLVHPSTWGGDIKEGYDATVGRVLGSGTPTTPDLSANQAATQQSNNLANNLASQRQNYQATGAPQIQADGSVSAPSYAAGTYGGNGIAPRQPTAGEINPANAPPPPAPGSGGWQTSASQPGQWAKPPTQTASAGGAPAPPAPMGPPAQLLRTGASPSLPMAVRSPLGGAAPGAPTPAPGGANGPVSYAQSFGTAPPTNGQLQTGALGMLQSQAAGTAPSAAQIQTQQNLGTQMANQYALASALQGRHPGAAYNAAAQGTATAQGTAAGQGALLRAQEQAQAQNTYATAVGGARGQDITTQTANLNAQLTNEGYDEQTKNALLTQQLVAQGMTTTEADAIIAAQTASAASQNAFKGGILSGAISGASTYAAS